MGYSIIWSYTPTDDNKWCPRGVFVNMRLSRGVLEICPGGGVGGINACPVGLQLKHTLVQVRCN